MKRHFFIATLLVLSVLLTGCLQIFVPAPTATLPPTAIPTLVTLMPTLGLQTVFPTDTQLAPLCAADPLLAVCAAPIVQERDKYCVEKLPYVQFAMAPGVTFESLNPELKCADQGIRGGEQVIACTGQPLIAYDLKVCNAACNASSLLIDPSKCAQGFGYSAQAGCCWPLPTDDAGCVLVKVNIGACR